MKVVVTGACGFVGQHMVRLLSASGYTVVATDHPSAKIASFPPNVSYFAVDLTDATAVHSFFASHQFDIAFLVASVFNYAMARDEIIRINSAIMRNCLENIHLTQKSDLKHVVAWISASVYGESYQNGLTLTEYAPMKPRNAYEESKLCQHLICQEYLQRLPLSLIFPMGIYGPGSAYGITTFIDMMRLNQMPGYPNGGKNRISLVHVEDVCRAALFLALRDDTIGKRYNLGEKTSHSVKAMMHYVKRCYSDMGFPVDLYPVSIPMWLMKALAWRSVQLAQKYKRAPIVQKDFLGYLEHDMLLDTRKLRELGFVYHYDDTILDGGLKSVLNWQLSEGLIKPPCKKRLLGMFFGHCEQQTGMAPLYV